VVLKAWVTGDKAVQDEDESQCELDGFMRELMELSGQRNFIGHKSLPTDKGSRKLGRSHTDNHTISQGRGQT
jgi:hypothetical protein